MLRKQSRETGEALSGDGHAILNPFGNIIKVSSITIGTLDRRGYLARDRRTGLKQIKGQFAALLLLLERTTLHRELYAALGPDFTGPNTVVCPCEICGGKAADIDHTRLPGKNTLESDETDSIIRDLKRRRRIA